MRSRRPVPASLRALAGAAAALAPLACGGDTPAAPREDAAPAAEARPAPARAVRLCARREVALPGRPIGLATRDVDGDGTDDCLVVTKDPGALSVLRGGPEGLVPFGEPRALGDDFPLGPADLGAAGVAVALQGEPALLLFARPGDPPLSVALAATPRALGAGDVDGDGEPEALVALADDTLAVVRRAAGGLEARAYALPGPLSGRATVLHALGDGRVAVGAQIDEALLVVALGPEPGAAELVRRVALGGIPRAALERDLDGDGDPELVVAGGDASVWVLGLGAPGGHAAWIEDGSAPRDLGSPGAVPVALRAADLDRDGRDELVLIDAYDSGYALLGRFDPGGAPALRQKEYAGQDPVDGALGDFDGDGRLDLAVANRGARRVGMVRGTGYAQPGRAAFLEARRVPVASNPIRVRSLNLDEDPLPEAVVLCAGDRVVLARRNRHGLLEAEGPVLLRETGARGLAAAATPAGGRIGVLEPGDAGARILLLGAAGDAPRALAAGREARDLVALDDAGAAVLAAVDPAGRAVHVARADDGRAVRSLALAAPPLAACGVELDGDPRAELAVATAGELLLFDDLERPLPPIGIEVAGHVPRALAAADVDGDGAQDLVLLYAGAADTAPGRVAVLLARGGGAFRRSAPVETGLAPAALAAGDLDGDGRAEVLVASQNSHIVDAWTPSADGLRRLPGIGAGLGPLDVHLADLDLDGRLDLIVANSFSHDLSVVYNLAER